MFYNTPTPQHIFNIFLNLSLNDWKNHSYKNYVIQPVLTKIDFSQSSNISLFITPINKIYSFKERFFSQRLTLEKIQLNLSFFTSAARHTALDISAKIDKIRQILSISETNLRLLDNTHSSQLNLQKMMKEKLNLFSPEIQQYIIDFNILDNIVEPGNKEKIAQIMLINTELQDKITKAVQEVIYINKLPLIYQKAFNAIIEKGVSHKDLTGRDFIEKIANYLPISTADKRKLICDSYGIIYYYQQFNQTPLNNSPVISKFMKFGKTMRLSEENHDNKETIKAYRLD